MMTGTGLLGIPPQLSPRLWWFGVTWYLSNCLNVYFAFGIRSEPRLGIVGHRYIGVS